ncbi:hypothetical protein [Microbacterium sp. EST19A]|uniref:hypothetical protein n=1 Tax=Microbacterium sp. EST19A TaxID=2862681 RepID=UPI001CBF5329|nr:hypothetical protein [Microbacterium sp. EST19A]
MNVYGSWAPIPRDKGVNWSRESLDLGSRFSRQVAARFEGEQVRAYAILPRDRESIDVADFSHSAQIGEADLLLGRFLQSLAAAFDGILVVDDDLARRGDPRLEGVSYVDDRVIRWVDLQSAPGDLTRLVRTGASGYPLNAFVCANTGGHAFHPPAGPLSEPDVVLLAGEVRMVIHSIFDTESFLLLVIDDEVNAVLESFAYASE